jgi:pilus assembly protein CpaB
MQSRVLAVLIAVVLALVATAALVVYVNGADRRAIADQTPIRVLVATVNIKAGTSGEDAQIRKQIGWREVPRQSAVENGFRSVAQLEGKFAAVDIVKGEQLLPSRWVGANEVEGRGLLPIPDDHQALSIGLDLTRQVAGFVTPGDNVGMVVTLPNGNGTNTTKFLIQNVRVLAVGATALTTRTAQGGGGRVNQGKGSQSLTAITLAVKNKHVERVVHAAEDGNIYLTLMPRNAIPAPRSAGGQGITDGNLYPDELE